MSAKEQSIQVDALLDTSIISAMLDVQTDLRAQDEVFGAIGSYGVVGVPVVAYAEYAYGIENSEKVSATYEMLYELIKDMPIVPITGNTVQPYIQARQAVDRKRQRLNDVWIAASALEHSAIILTSDTDFDKFTAFGAQVRRISLN